METEFLKFLGLRTYIATDNNLATKIHIFYEEILLRGGGGILIYRLKKEQPF